MPGIRSAGSSASEIELPAALAQWRALDTFATVTDVGANEGQTALRFARLFPNATIYSLEPDPKAFEALLRHTGGDPRLRCFQIALGERDGELDLNINQASVTNSFLTRAPQAEGKYYYDMMRPVRTEKVCSMTLLRFCREHDIAYADLLKLDTQGFEDRILRGGGEWLHPDRVGSIFLEVLFAKIYEGQAEFDVVYKLLRERGYKIHSFHDIQQSPPTGLLWADALFVKA